MKSFFLIHITINWDICNKKTRDDDVEKIRTKFYEETENPIYVRLACKDICLFVAMSALNGGKENQFVYREKSYYGMKHKGMTALKQI